ncbi:MAG: hypothetical protein ACRD1R_20355 [Acidobacteriota bacterium]
MQLPETSLEKMTVYAKYFDPASHWRWYVIECDGEDTLFGIIVSRHAAVVGQFTLAELQSLAGVERDLQFRPISVAELAKRERNITEVLPGSSDLVPLV